MYIKRTFRKNKDGSKVVYIQLAHNYWDSEAKCSKTKVIYSFMLIRLNRDYPDGVVENKDKTIEFNEDMVEVISAL